MSKEITKINVTEREQLDMLYNDSALTIEGLSEDSIPDFIEWIEEKTPLKERKVYVISGEVMNKQYNLTENNAYPNNLTIVSVMSNDIKNIGAVTIPRFDVGARWFDDIVDNNLRRER